MHFSHLPRHIFIWWIRWHIYMSGVFSFNFFSNGLWHYKESLIWSDILDYTETSKKNARYSCWDYYEPLNPNRSCFSDFWQLWWVIRYCFVWRQFRPIRYFPVQLCQDLEEEQRCGRLRNLYWFTRRSGPLSCLFSILLTKNTSLLQNKLAYQLSVSLSISQMTMIY